MANEFSIEHNQNTNDIKIKLFQDLGRLQSKDPQLRAEGKIRILEIGIGGGNPEHRAYNLAARNQRSPLNLFAFTIDSPIFQLGNPPYFCLNRCEFAILSTELQPDCC